MSMDQNEIKENNRFLPLLYQVLLVQWCQIKTGWKLLLYVTEKTVTHKTTFTKTTKILLIWLWPLDQLTCCSPRNYYLQSVSSYYKGWLYLTNEWKFIHSFIIYHFCNRFPSGTGSCKSQQSLGEGSVSPSTVRLFPYRRSKLVTVMINK